MVSPPDTRLELETYLRELRIHLGNLPASEVDDITRELESHISERLVRDERVAIGEVLSRFGPPRDLASRYLVNQAVSGGTASTTPARVFAAAGAWMHVSVQAVWTLCIAIAGYFLSASFLAAAMLKPVFPDRTGLWRLPDGDSYSLRLGLGTRPPQGEELLGWLLIPSGLFVSVLLFFTVTQYSRSVLARAKWRLEEGRHKRRTLGGN